MKCKFYLVWSREEGGSLVPGRRKFSLPRRPPREGFSFHTVIVYTYKLFEKITNENVITTVAGLFQEQTYAEWITLLAAFKMLKRGIIELYS